MSMCLLEVAMCGKCRSSHFQSEGGESKKFEDRGGLKNFRTGGVTDLGGGYFCWGGGGGQYPITCHEKVPELKQLRNIKGGGFNIDGILRFSIFIKTIMCMSFVLV